MQIEIHEHAANDLDALSETDPEAAAEIIELLGVLSIDSDLAECLYREYTHYSHPQFDVKKFQALYRQGYNAYRIKTLGKSTAPSHRVLYICDMRIDTAYILAVAPRSFNYDPQHPIVRRFLEDCEDIGIPQYR